MSFPHKIGFMKPKGDIIPPAIISAEIGTVNSTTLVMTYGETLNPTSVPATTAFSVSAPLSSPTVSGVAILGLTVRLTLSTAILYGDTVTVSYTKPGSNPLQDVAGNDCINLVNYAVTNNVGFISQYQSVWNSFTNKPTVADAKIQNYTLNALVAGGYYAKAELLDVFSAHSNTAGESQKNWKNPGTFDPTIVNSPGWVAYAGFTGAATKYIELNFNPTTNGTLVSQNNICMIWGVGTNVDETTYDVGGNDAAVYFRHRARSSNFARMYCNDATAKTGANASSIKHYAMSRGVAANYDSYINLVKVNQVVASTGLVNISLLACGVNGNGSKVGCTKQLRYVFIFSYLTQAEVQAVMGIMNTYLTNYGTNLY